MKIIATDDDLHMVLQKFQSRKVVSFVVEFRVEPSYKSSMIVDVKLEKLPVRGIQIYIIVQLNRMVIVIEKVMMIWWIFSTSDRQITMASSAVGFQAAASSIEKETRKTKKEYV